MSVKQPLLYKHDRAPNVVLTVLHSRGWREWRADIDAMDQWSLLWTTGRPKPSDFATVREYQRINHFPKTSLLCTKDNLARGLRRMRGILGRQYNFNPLTFILPNDYSKFLQAYLSSPGTTWICKPVDLSRGRKIYIFTDIKELVYDYPVIVQRYISRPWLIGEYKWDMRLYILVTSYHPLTIYLYTEGLARFSTDKFDMSNLSNRFSHLTNTSINRQHPSVCTSSKWSFSQLRTYLTSIGFNTDHLWQEIRRIIILTLLVIVQEVPR